MLIVLLCLAIGMLLGVFLRHRENILRFIDRLTVWFIYFFLFLLGLAVGLNRTVIDNLGRIGLQALIIAAAAVAGSVIPAFFLYRFFYRRTSREK